MGIVGHSDSGRDSSEPPLGGASFRQAEEATRAHPLRRMSSRPPALHPAFMRSVFEQSPVPMFVVDGDWRIVAANTCAVAEYGYLRKELIGAIVPFVSVVPGKSGPRGAPATESDVPRLSKDLLSLAGRVLEMPTCIRLANDEVQPVAIRATILFGEAFEETHGAVIVVLPAGDSTGRETAFDGEA